MSETTKLNDAAIREIERLTIEGQKTQLITHQALNGRIVIARPGGEFVIDYPPAPWHGETLDTPEELATYAKAHSPAYAREDTPAPADDMPQRPEIFYDEAGIVFVRDEADRRDRAMCGLAKSPQYMWLLGESKKELTQQEIVRVLRITFRGCLPADSQLLPLLRKLKFTSDGQIEGTFDHGKESMGRQINQQVAASVTLPEEFTLTVPVFENHPFKVRIACALELFPAEQVFRITPYPMVMREAMDQALADVARTLRDSGLPIYRGRP